MNMVHSVISGIWHILITADSKSMCGSVFRNGHLSIVDCVCVCQHVLFVHLFIYSISLCWCVCCNRALVFFNVCMSSMCVCVCACACARIGVTGNLKRERLVSPQHDDFLCQQTVSRKIDPYYDEINFNGQGFQIFPTKSLKIRTFNDASLGSALLSSSVELFCLPC